MKRILPILLALLLLTACGKKTSAPVATQTEPASTQTYLPERYYFYSMTADGQTQTAEDFAAIAKANDETFNDSAMYFVLHEDGTALLSLDGETREMQWRNGQLWETEAPDQTVHFTHSDSVVTMDYEGVTLEFRKR